MPNPPSTQFVEPSPDSSLQNDYASGPRFRARDSIGALNLENVAADVAYARGHAHGIEEGREESFDLVRTTLLTILEVKFGEVNDEMLEMIELADHPRLRRYTVAAATAEVIDDVFL
jgi:hypothetical protein